MADILDDLLDRHEYHQTKWQDSRTEAETDMRFVAGNPWDADDETHRKGRPTIAPEEMGQYFNQVINQLWANPRGMKFAPRGGGASEAGARFYQNKAREIEYRSHAKVAYITAAADAIQRSYGFVRVVAKYASPRSANQELWIEACPNPDMVSPDPDAKSPDSSDMRDCFVEEWRDDKEFKRQYPKAKVVSFGDKSAAAAKWQAGARIRIAEYWHIRTKPRTLLLVQPPASWDIRTNASGQLPAPVQVFEDEISPGGHVMRELRKVDYPTVTMYLTNGLEILDQEDWPGKYIPIVSCYGKVLYVPEGGETKRKLMSMTRFGRAPWKAMCYADSSICEVTSSIVKSGYMVPKGTFPGLLGTAVQEAMHTPKAFTEYDDDPGKTGQKNGPPQRPDSPMGQHLQALLLVSERFRRGIQSAMASNFLPSQAQRSNEKTGIALKEIKDSASTGTFHFVNSYDDMIRQIAVINEDLIPHYYDYAGETSIMEADGSASVVQINGAGPDAVSTKGDYLVTVSTGPSSDSEREAVQDFSEGLVQNIAQIAQIAGPKVAAAVFAKAIRLRNGGPEMDALADLIEPPEFKKKDDGEQPDPEVMALQGQLQQMEQQLQQAGQIIDGKQVEAQAEKEMKGAEIQAKRELAMMDLEFQKLKLDVESETKLSVAALGAKVDRMVMLIEQQQRLADHVHETALASADAQHEARMADRAHQQGLEDGEQGAEFGRLAADQSHQQALETQAMQPQQGQP